MVDTAERFAELEMAQRMDELDQLEKIEISGQTTIQDDVVAAVAGVAAREVEGVSALGTSSIRKTLSERVGGGEKRARGVGVELGRKEAVIDITLKCIYGISIPQTVSTVRKNVAARLYTMCGLIAREININVVGIEFPDRMPGRLE